MADHWTESGWKDSGKRERRWVCNIDRRPSNENSIKQNQGNYKGNLMLFAHLLWTSWLCEIYSCKTRWFPCRELVQRFTEENYIWKPENQSVWRYLSAWRASNGCVQAWVDQFGGSQRASSWNKAEGAWQLAGLKPVPSEKPQWRTHVLMLRPGTLKVRRSSWQMIWFLLVRIRLKCVDFSVSCRVTVLHGPLCALTKLR